MANTKDSLPPSSNTTRDLTLPHRDLTVPPSSRDPTTTGNTLLLSSSTPLNREATTRDNLTLPSRDLTMATVHPHSREATVDKHTATMVTVNNSVATTRENRHLQLRVITELVSNLSPNSTNTTLREIESQEMFRLLERAPISSPPKTTDLTEVSVPASTPLVNTRAPSPVLQVTSTFRTEPPRDTTTGTTCQLRANSAVLKVDLASLPSMAGDHS